MSSIKKYFKSNPNAICDVCGRKRKWSEVTMSFGTGIVAVIVACIDGCADDLHPLNFPPPVIFDGRPIPNARPDATDDNRETFVQITMPSGMSWGHLKKAGAWGVFNNPNIDFNFAGIWSWGFFRVS